MVESLYSYFIAELFCQDVLHQQDRLLKITDFFGELKLFDWARTPRGHCTDAQKSITVG